MRLFFGFLRLLVLNPIASLGQSGFHNALGREDLQGTGHRINGHSPVFSPPIGVIVFIHVHQHVDVSFVRLEDDPTPILIDANGAEGFVSDRLDGLVIDSVGGGVVLELQRPFQNLPLNTVRQA